MAETIKPSSSRKHLAAGFRLVGGGRAGRRGPLARQPRQHACLSECAIVPSIALRCQITLEWTAATSTSAPSACLDATLCVSHSVWNTDPETERGGGRENKGAEEKVDKREDAESSLLSYTADSDDMLPLSLLSPHAGEHRVHYRVTQRQNPPAFLRHIEQISKASVAYIITSFG